MLIINDSATFVVMAPVIWMLYTALLSVQHVTVTVTVMLPQLQIRTSDMFCSSVDSFIIISKNWMTTKAEALAFINLARYVYTQTLLYYKRFF